MPPLQKQRGRWDTRKSSPIYWIMRTAQASGLLAGPSMVFVAVVAGIARVENGQTKPQYARKDGSQEYYHTK